MSRVTVPVPDSLRERARVHPEDFGLPPGASEARVFATLIEVGARVLLDAREGAERAQLYAEWADDHERREAVSASMALAVQDGIL